MLVTFFCEHCDAKLRINADAMGTDLECPECEAVIKVPYMQLGPGFVIGGFLIKHKLGEGGMGEVYLATQLSLERDIALKILPSRFTRENSFVVRFLKEVLYQAKLDHPNIVTAYDAGEDNGVYFMAMAYVSGETLEERLERDGPLHEKDALQVVRQVAKALEYASDEKGILHRDIKPSNIMLTPSLHAKVLDMGLSKNTMERTSTTVADTLMGTPNYMSPEQIDHPQDLDTRSDMFSLGMTLYHMLTGQVPFEETSYLKTLQRHAREQLEDPRDLIPGVSQGSAHFIARLLARDPEDRYPNWQVLLDDLQDLITHKKIPRTPEGESTLDLLPPPPPEEKNKPETSPFRRRSYTAPQDAKSPQGVVISIVTGLTLGIAAILLIAQKMTSQVESPPPIPTPQIVSRPTATPEPLPERPSAESASLQKELTTIILNYERNRDNYDHVIRALLDVGMRGTDNSISEAAAEQIVRIRRDRDEAVETEKKRLQETTIRILYEQGPDAAREYLEQVDGPFQDDFAAQTGNLRRRIRIWEQQEFSQREEEKTVAVKWLTELRTRLAPLVIQGEWESALDMVNHAAKEPPLFPVSADVAALREEMIALQGVPEKILKSYAGKLNQPILLNVQDKDIEVTLRELKPDGLLVSRIVYADDGSPLGSAELFIPFNTLSSTEIETQLETLEGKEVLIFHGLLAYRNGERDAARSYLEVAESPLALAIRDEIFSLPSLNPFLPGRSSDLESPLNRLRFAPLPTSESP